MTGYILAVLSQKLRKTKHTPKEKTAVLSVTRLNIFLLSISFFFFALLTSISSFSNSVRSLLLPLVSLFLVLYYRPWRGEWYTEAMGKSLAKNPLRERIFYVKLDRVLVPLAMAGLEEVMKGTHPMLEGLEKGKVAELRQKTMMEVLKYMPKRMEDKMDAKELAEISRRPGVIIFPMSPVGSTTLQELPKMVPNEEIPLNREELLEAAGVELVDEEETNDVNE